MNESLHIAVARRLRGVMGERRLSQDAVCKIVGWNRGYMHRRYVGETALDVNDLATLETVGISMRYLLMGETEVVGLPDPAEYLRERIRRRRPERNVQLP
jgi:hypothetical protein